LAAAVVVDLVEVGSLGSLLSLVLQRQLQVTTTIVVVSL
jgi:hypothetical protein